MCNMDNKELKGENNLNIEILRMLEKNLNLDFSLSEKLQETHRIKLKDKVYLNMAEKFEWPNINLDSSQEKVFCYGLRNQVGILVDGTVVPCCLDSEGTIELGNIFNTSFTNIIEGKRASDIYNGFSKRMAVEELCKKCGYAKRFKK